MSSFTLSPNMDLPIPTVGREPGPDYASDVNASLTLIDSHDHTAGNGVLITPLALNINTDLTFANNFAINVAGINFEARSSTPIVGTIYERGVDLYYVDGLGNDVRITQDGGVAGTPGSISGLVPPASATYVAGNSTFVWQSNTNIAANMDIGSVLLRNLSPNSTFALTLAPPAGLSSNFQITLPVLPASQSFMTINSSGVIQAPAAFNQGLVNSNLANETITAAKIAPQTIDGSRMVNHTVTFLQLDQAIFEAQEITYVITPATFAVRAASTVNGTLSTAFHNGSVIDGVTLATNDLILIKNQTLGSENGVYVVQAAGVPLRSTSYDTVGEINFAGVIVSSGTANTGKSFYQNAYLASLITDAQVWSESQTFEFVVPATGVNFIEYEMCGGGGGSGSGGSGNVSGNRTGAGGGGGGAIKTTGFMNVSANDVISITVGVGGPGGTGAGASGSNGSISLIVNNNTSERAAASGGGGGGGGSAPSGVGKNGLAIVGLGGIAGTTGSQSNGGGGGASLGNGGDGSDSTADAPAVASIYGGGGGGGGGGTTQHNGASGADNIYGYSGGAAGAGTSGGSGGGGGGAGPYGNGAAGAAGANAGTAGIAPSANTGAGAGGASGMLNNATGKAGAKGSNGKAIIRYFGS